MIRSVDSNVLVLALAAVQQIHIDELWVTFAMGKSLVHEIAFYLGPEKFNALPFLHAFWHSIIHCWSWKENSMVNLEDMWWGHSSILYISLYWWSAWGTGVLCSSSVCLYIIMSTETKV